MNRITSSVIKNGFFHLLIVVTVGLAAYSNTFDVPFQFDDAVEIAENSVIRDLGNFIFSSEGYQFNPRRYIGYLTFALNYHFGRLDVTGYHIVNLAVHVLNAILVYSLVTLTFKTPYLVAKSTEQSAENGKNDGSSPAPCAMPFAPFIALFAALLFVSHPVQIQAVTYIVQRLTSLATMFYLLSVVMYVKGRLGAMGQGQEVITEHLPIAHRLLPTACFFLSLLSAVLAMKTKEITFTLPIIIVLYEFVFFRSSPKKKLLYLVPVLLTILIVPASVLQTDKPLGDVLSDLSEKTRVQTNISRPDYLMTEMRVIVTYIRLIFLPINQNLDYDYPISRSFTPPVLMSFLLLSFLLGTATWLLYRSRQGAKGSQQSAVSHQPSEDSRFTFYRLIAFGILWFFIGLSVESSVIPIADVIFEHRVYLPSAGAFIAIAAAFSMAAQELGRRRIPAWIIFIPPAVIILILSAATYVRNSIWKDGGTLWEDIVKKAPGNARGHNNLGFIYYERGMLDRAKGQFITALRLRPEYLDARVNLGIVYNAEGMADQAIEQYMRVLSVNPEDADAHNNLGIAYVSKGMVDQGLAHYQIALRINPDYPEAYNNLGVAYATKGMLDQAITYFRHALQLKPDYFDAHYNLARAFLKNNDAKNAEEVYRRLLRTNPEAAKRLLALLRGEADLNPPRP